MSSSQQSPDSFPIDPNERDDFVPDRYVVDRGGSLEVIVVRVDATQSTVQVGGELDLATADLLGAVLDSERQQGRQSVRVDMSGVNFMDCAGLGVLTRAHDEFRAAGCTIALTGVRSQPGRLLALTGQNEVLFVAAEPTDSDAAPHLRAVPDRRSADLTAPESSQGPVG